MSKQVDTDDVIYCLSVLGNAMGKLSAFQNEIMGYGIAPGVLVADIVQARNPVGIAKMRATLLETLPVIQKLKGE